MPEKNRNMTEVLTSANNDLPDLLLLRHTPCPALIAQRSESLKFSVSLSVPLPHNLLYWLLYQHLLRCDLTGYNAIHLQESTLGQHTLVWHIVIYRIKK